MKAKEILGLAVAGIASLVTGGWLASQWIQGTAETLGLAIWAPLAQNIAALAPWSWVPGLGLEPQDLMPAMPADWLGWLWTVGNQKLLALIFGAETLLAVLLAGIVIFSVMGILAVVAMPVGKTGG